MTSARVALVLTLSALAVAAQSPARGRQFERLVVATGSGPHRLEPDGALVARAAPFTSVQPIRQGVARAHGGLADLRLIDGGGKEVPYILVHGRDSEPQFRSASVLPIAATKKTSGFEAALNAPVRVDLLRIDIPRRDFLKRLIVEGSGDRQRWTMLAPEATVFDLPAEDMRMLDVPFAAGEYRYLRVTWDDTNSGRMPLPARVFAREVPDDAPQQAGTVDATVVRRPSEPGVSRYRLTLPGPGLPVVAVRLEAGGGHVMRTARISESRLTGSDAVPFQLAEGVLKRVVRDGATASALRLPIAPPREAQLDLTIEDGSNPPLEITRATFELAMLPWIYFEAPGGTIVARFGSRATAPSYDLEAVRESIDLARVPIARWGGEPREVTPVETTVPASSATPSAGAELDRNLFPYQRAIPAGSAGLATIQIDAAVLAHSRGSRSRFADVRLIDAGGRQVPYILERREEPLTVELKVEKAAATVPGLTPRAGQALSAYALELPYENLPGGRLVIETTARVFRRGIRVGVERAPDRDHRDPWFEELHATTWVHADQSNAAPALVLPLNTIRGTDLRLVVDEGDNQPLPITASRLLLPSWWLRFYRGAEPLTLAYGRPDLDAPQYDLALLATEIMGAAAEEVRPAAESAQTTAGPFGSIPPSLFWVGLGIAALVIGVIIVRLVKST